jgi:homoserine kinase
VRITVRVPATSANLGPGFDCFGLALDLCNEVTLDTDAEPGVAWEGEGADELPTDGSDLISRTIAHVGSFHDLTPPPMRLTGRNRIPLERGLGSSSAATVAGVVLGSRLFDLSIDGHGSSTGHDPYSVFALAAEIEGHPDNAAPAAFGGFTIAMPERGGLVHRLDPHPSLRPAVLVPEAIRLPTAEARGALPVQVSREDATFNAAHAALMVEAITRDPSLLRAAMRDRLHQQVRLSLVPGAHEVFRSVSSANVPVCVSGAGPSLLAFESDEHPLPDPGAGWTVLRVGARARGFEVLAS